jgi:hypothetical protein
LSIGLDGLNDFVIATSYDDEVSCNNPMRSQATYALNKCVQDFTTNAFQVLYYGGPGVAVNSIVLSNHSFGWNRTCTNTPVVTNTEHSTVCATGLKYAVASMAAEIYPNTTTLR